MGEIVVSTGGTTLGNAVCEAVKAGELKRIFSNIYTTAVDSTLEQVVKRNLYLILASLYPSAVISHRSALEGGPKEGHIVLTYRYTKKVTLPGIIVHLVAGPGNLEGDMPFAGGLFLASPERAWLDNCRATKAHGFSRILPAEKLEELLDDYIRLQGESVFREKIKALHRLAEANGLEKEAIRFQNIAGAILGTRNKGILRTERAISRADGLPFDPDRIYRFERLFQTLHANDRGHGRIPIAEIIKSGEALTNLCFFDAYFSNYIEGTRFEVDDARKIVFEGRISSKRPEGHDVLGAFRTLFAMTQGSLKEWENFDEFMSTIKRYHADIMKAHPDKFPGQFKTMRNYAGSTAFVDPELVEGTLRKGFEFFRALSDGFARAVFAKFLLAEVHPFTDGNGRLSRIVMNRGFFVAREVPIIIPTVYRIDYLGAIKKLTKTDDPSVFIRMLQRAQNFTASLDFSTFESARISLDKARAFSDDPEDVLIF